MSERNGAEIHLHNLSTVVPDLADGKASFQIECCVWCMLQTNQKNGSNIRVVEGRTKDIYNVTWDESRIDYHKITNSVHDDEAIEYGAEAIALNLAVLRTEYDTVRRSKKGKGDDYRLVKAGARLFQGSAKLEVSGVLVDDTGGRQNARLKDKLKQVSEHDKHLPGCAIVVEFSKFVAKVAWNDS